MSDALPRSDMYEEALMIQGYTGAKVYVAVGGYLLQYNKRLAEILTAHTGHVDSALLRIMSRHLDKFSNDSEDA